MPHTPLRVPYTVFQAEFNACFSQFKEKESEFLNKLSGLIDEPQNKQDCSILLAELVACLKLCKRSHVTIIALFNQIVAAIVNAILAKHNRLSDDDIACIRKEIGFELLLETKALTNFGIGLYLDLSENFILTSEITKKLTQLIELIPKDQMSAHVNKMMYVHHEAVDDFAECCAASLGVLDEVCVFLEKEIHVVGGDIDLTQPRFLRTSSEAATQASSTSVVDETAVQRFKSQVARQWLVRYIPICFTEEETAECIRRLKPYLTNEHDLKFVFNFCCDRFCHDQRMSEQTFMSLLDGAQHPGIILNRVPTQRQRSAISSLILAQKWDELRRLLSSRHESLSIDTKRQMLEDLMTVDFNFTDQHVYSAVACWILPLRTADLTQLGEYHVRKLVKAMIDHSEWAALEALIRVGADVSRVPAGDGLMFVNTYIYAVMRRHAPTIRAIPDTVRDSVTAQMVATAFCREGVYASGDVLEIARDPHLFPLLANDRGACESVAIFLMQHRYSEALTELQKHPRVERQGMNLNRVIDGAFEPGSKVTVDDIAILLLGSTEEEIKSLSQEDALQLLLKLCQRGLINESIIEWLFMQPSVAQQGKNQLRRYTDKPNCLSQVDALRVLIEANNHKALAALLKHAKVNNDSGLLVRQDVCKMQELVSYAWEHGSDDPLLPEVVVALDTHCDRSVIDLKDMEGLSVNSKYQLCLAFKEYFEAQLEIANSSDDVYKVQRKIEFYRDLLNRNVRPRFLTTTSLNVYNDLQQAIANKVRYVARQLVPAEGAQAATGVNGQAPTASTASC